MVMIGGCSGFSEWMAECTADAEGRRVCLRVESVCSGLLIIGAFVESRVLNSPPRDGVD